MREQTKFSYLKLGAWSGVAYFILVPVRATLIYFKGFMFSQSVNSFLLLLSLISAILFSYGFVELGRKLKSKFLQTISWIMVAFLLASLILFLFLPAVVQKAAFASAQPAATQPSSPTSPDSSSNAASIDQESVELAKQQAIEEALQNSLNTILQAAFFVWIVLSIILGAYYILFGVALINLSDKLRFSLATGIVEIISGATFITTLGILIRPLANIGEIAILFQAHKQFCENSEKRKRNKKFKSKT